MLKRTCVIISLLFLIGESFIFAESFIYSRPTPPRALRRTSTKSMKSDYHLSNWEVGGGVGFDLGVHNTTLSTLVNAESGPFVYYHQYFTRPSGETFPLFLHISGEFTFPLSDATSGFVALRRYWTYALSLGPGYRWHINSKQSLDCTLSLLIGGLSFADTAYSSGTLLFGGDLRVRYNFAMNPRFCVGPYLAATLFRTPYEFAVRPTFGIVLGGGR